MAWAGGLCSNGHTLFSPVDADRDYALFQRIHKRTTALKSKKKTTAGKTTKTAKAASTAAAGPMNVEFLEQLVSLMAANDLNTVDLRDSGRRIVLKRGAVAPVMMSAAPVAYPPAGMPAATAAAPAAGGAGGAPASAVDEEAGLVPIKSPMVGTFYAASSPDAKPFVSVGSRVEDETDVCIIEAMKVFNNIKAECRGTIAKVLVTNGQTVEFGTVLFLVKPA